MHDCCDGCAQLRFERWPRNYVAQCTDPDKPVLGARRVMAVSTVGAPFHIQRPAWCRGKEETNGSKDLCAVSVLRKDQPA